MSFEKITESNSKYDDLELKSSLELLKIINKEEQSVAFSVWLSQHARATTQMGAKLLALLSGRQHIRRAHDDVAATSRARKVSVGTRRLE